MKNKFILLTGGAGYIGSHLSNLLIEKNYKFFLSRIRYRLEQYSQEIFYDNQL